MERNDFLNAVIDDGQVEIITTYTRPDQILKKEGGIAGFEVCRGQSDEEITALLVEAKRATQQARDIKAPDYWKIVMYERQIEWVANVLSGRAVLLNETPISTPTLNGARKAAGILHIEAFA